MISGRVGQMGRDLSMLQTNYGVSILSVFAVQVQIQSYRYPSADVLLHLLIRFADHCISEQKVVPFLIIKIMYFFFPYT